MFNIKETVLDWDDGLSVDPVVIINNAIGIAMGIINFTLAAYKGDSLSYRCNCKRHNLLGTKIAGVIINCTLNLASSHYSSGPGQTLAGEWLTALLGVWETSPFGLI